MCPLRFILVFFSAVLAGYFAWRTVNASSPAAAGEADVSNDDSTVHNKIGLQKQDSNMTKMIQNGFWVFVDMASGRYLWRNFKEIKTQRES